MNCELCGVEIGDAAFGDVDGAIVCPRCLGHVPGVPADPEVVEFYKRNGEYNEDPVQNGWVGSDGLP